MGFHILEHRLLAFYKNYQNLLKGKKLLLASSGGLDSMVALHLHLKLSRSLDFELQVAHIHHGQSEKKQTQRYRREASNFVEAQCKELGLVSVSAQSSQNLVSQDEYNRFRRKNILELQKELDCAFILLANHQDYLLETRLIQLIRVTSDKGLKSLKAWRPPWVRPLLHFSRAELESYQSEKEISFYEDPSNKDLSYLRNWIRGHWLKELEQQRLGSTKSLARSLNYLATLTLPMTSKELVAAIHSQGLNMRAYYLYSESEKSQIVTQFLSSQGVTHYTSSHISEMMKRLDLSSKKSQSASLAPFCLLGCYWQVKEGFLSLSKSPT